MTNGPDPGFHRGDGWNSNVAIVPYPKSHSPKLFSCNRVSASPLLNTIFHIEINKNEREKCFFSSRSNSRFLWKSLPLFLCLKIRSLGNVEIIPVLTSMDTIWYWYCWLYDWTHKQWRYEWGVSWLTKTYPFITGSEGESEKKGLSGWQTQLRRLSLFLEENGYSRLGIISLSYSVLTLAWG